MNRVDMQKMITQKRLIGEIKNLEKNREPYYQVVHDETDMFKFYFLIRGDNTSDYKGGYYIGTITLPQDYPASPGDFYMLTPSGRFLTGQKICLTNSGYHRDTWSPIWNIQNMVIGFISIFGSDDEHGISHIKLSPLERRELAQRSIDYNKTYHNEIFKKFDYFVNPDGSVKSEEEVVKLVDESKPKKKKKDKSHQSEAVEETVKEIVKEIVEETQVVDKPNSPVKLELTVPTNREEWLNYVLASDVETFNYDWFQMFWE